MAEDRRQMTEDRGQKTEVGSGTRLRSPSFAAAIDAEGGKNAEDGKIRR